VQWHIRRIPSVRGDIKQPRHEIGRTGRSFFTMTRDIPPRDLFWPWTWAVLSILTFAWPFWLGGSSAALLKATGGTAESMTFGIKTYYLWCWGGTEVFRLGERLWAVPLAVLLA
jgi:hypothetical protein